MRRALALAARARGRTAPNPMVGAVIVRRGRVLAEGFHAKAGTAHAEIVALAKLPRGGARGATVYVSLEPCNHHGRTGPCSEALIEAGVARVVAAMEDPNPRVSGGGIARLRAAGVAAEVGLLDTEARRLNAGFVCWITRGRPRVTLKAAVSLDGRMASASGDARWITGEAARREAHRLRDASEAILVGAGTVRADDPQLTTRLPRGRDPLRVILDGRLTTPPTAKVARAGTLIATTSDAPAAAEARLRATGVEILRLPSAAPGSSRVDLHALLAELGRRGVLELLVEGGAAVHAAFLDAGLADRVIVFVAPKIIGAAGVPLVALPGATTMAEAWTLADVEVKRLGVDVMIAGRPGRAGMT